MPAPRRRHGGWTAYAQSKLANVLHAKALAKRLDALSRKLVGLAA